MTKLFPPYLDQGSKGPAVNVLGLLMIAAGYGELGDIVLDGNYTPGGRIARAVTAFQNNEGLTPQDGNFGPDSRKAFRRKFGIDVDVLTTEMFAGETIAVGPNKE